MNKIIPIILIASLIIFLTGGVTGYVVNKPSAVKPVVTQVFQKTTANTSCWDTDGGQNEYAFGECISFSTDNSYYDVSPDTCIDANKIEEQICVNKVYCSKVALTCPAGTTCQDGSCVFANPAAADMSKPYAKIYVSEGYEGIYYLYSPSKINIPNWQSPQPVFELLGYDNGLKTRWDGVENKIVFGDSIKYKNWLYLVLIGSEFNSNAAYKDVWVNSPFGGMTLIQRYASYYHYNDNNDFNTQGLETEGYLLINMYFYDSEGNEREAEVNIKTDKGDLLVYIPKGGGDLYIAKDGSTYYARDKTGFLQPKSAFRPDNIARASPSGASTEGLVINRVENVKLDDGRNMQGYVELFPVSNKDRFTLFSTWQFKEFNINAGGMIYSKRCSSGCLIELTNLDMQAKSATFLLNRANSITLKIGEIGSSDFNPHCFVFFKGFSLGGSGRFEAAREFNLDPLNLQSEQTLHGLDKEQPQQQYTATPRKRF